jgi:hypothetical protein
MSLATDFTACIKAAGPTVEARCECYNPVLVGLTPCVGGPNPLVDQAFNAAVQDATDYGCTNLRATTATPIVWSCPSSQIYNVTSTFLWCNANAGNSTEEGCKCSQGFVDGIEPCVGSDAGARGMLEKTVKNAVQKGCTSLVYRSTGPITDIGSGATRAAASMLMYAGAASSLVLAGVLYLA